MIVDTTITGAKSGSVMGGCESAGSYNLPLSEQEQVSMRLS